MIIDITMLKNNAKNSIDISTDFEVKKEDITVSDIHELKDLDIEGNISRVDYNTFTINASVAGVMVISDSITLEHIDYEFETEIEGNLDDLYEEIGQIFKKNENSIDIFPIIWENILMEIPISYSLNKTKLQDGDGWRVISDDTPVYNPELEKLKDLI